MENIWQFVAVFIGSALFFAYGAISKGIVIDKNEAVGIAQAAAAIVLIFAFLSGGKGCTSGSGDYDCRPAGPGIYNDC